MTDLVQITIFKGDLTKEKWLEFQNGIRTAIKGEFVGRLHGDYAGTTRRQQIVSFLVKTNALTENKQILAAFRRMYGTSINYTRLADDIQASKPLDVYL